MLLCDIGNTTLHFYDEGRDYRLAVEGFDPKSITESVGYISVNHPLSQRLKAYPNWLDVGDAVNREGYYEGMGIDRMVACEAVEDGVIVDVGSAITVDIVRRGYFEGGFIYPGIRAMQRCYHDISPLLDYSFNFELDLAKMPKNSQDAVSYGYLRTLVGEIRRHHGPMILTGGDAEHFASLFPEAQVDGHLIFKGMKMILETRC